MCQFEWETSQWLLYFVAVVAGSQQKLPDDELESRPFQPGLKCQFPHQSVFESTLFALSFSPPYATPDSSFLCNRFTQCFKCAFIAFRLFSSAVLAVGYLFRQPICQSGRSGLTPCFCRIVNKPPNFWKPLPSNVVSPFL